MRKLFLFWLASLCSISSLTGCGLFGNNHKDCSDGKCTVNYTPGPSRKAKSSDVAKADTVRTSVHVGIAKQSTPLTPGAIATVEELPTSPKKVERPNIESKDVSAQEDEIVRREAAGRRGKTVSRVPIREIAEPTAKPAVPEKEKTIELKNVDITYGAEEGFKSITGQVQQYRKTLRLRLRRRRPGRSARRRCGPRRRRRPEQAARRPACPRHRHAGPADIPHRNSDVSRADHRDSGLT